MQNRKIFHHTWYYFVELAVLLIGFALLFVFGFNVNVQFIIMLGILAVYIGMGVLHHKIHHDFSLKIVIEYILIAVLILAAFVFLNIGRI